MSFHTVPIPNPGGGGRYDLSSGDKLFIEFRSDGNFAYGDASNFSRETIPQGYFHNGDKIGPYSIDSQGQSLTVTLEIAEGSEKYQCVLTIAGVA